MDIVWIAVTVSFLLNIVVSTLIFKRNDFESSQKIGQLVLVWLIPFIASIGIWLFFRSEDSNNPRVDSFAKQKQHSSGSSAFHSSAGSGGSD